MGDGTAGAFDIPSPIKDRTLKVMASAMDGWDHVSVSVMRRAHVVAPVWPEMKFIKELFLGPDVWAIQYMPPVEENVSWAEVLHIWRPWDVDLPKPPREMV